MPILDIASGLDFVSPMAKDPPLLAIAYQPRIGNTYVHLGGGLYMSHNHALESHSSSTSESGQLTHILHSPQNVRAAKIIQKNTYVDADSEPLDLMTYFAPSAHANTSMPLLIPNDPKDLISKDILTAGIPARFGELFKSIGTIQEFEPNYQTHSSKDSSIRSSFPLYWTSAEALKGMSGSALYVNYSIESETRYLVTGTLVRSNSRRNGGFTAFTPTLYAQITDDMKAHKIDAQDVPNPVLSAGLSADQRLHNIKGTYLNEILLGTHHANKLQGGQGEDTLIGYGDADIYIFETGDGVDIIREFSEGEDIIEVNGKRAKSLDELGAITQRSQITDGIFEYHYGDGDIILIEKLHIDAL